VNEIADSRGLHDFFPFLFSLSSLKKGFFSFRFCCCTTFKYTKRKESKKDLRCWSSYISNPLVVVVYFTIHGTLIFLFIAQHVRNFDLKKREVARARKNLCITFAQDVSLPPHRQELIMKQ
jgi:hypothetical protein